MKAISILIRTIAIVGAAAAVYFYLDLGDELEETRTELDSTQLTLSQTERRLTDTTAERDELQETVAELETNLEESQSRIAMQDARIEELQGELESTQEALEVAREDVEDYRSQANRYRADLIAAQGELEDGVGVDPGILGEQQREIERLQRELAEARERLNELSPDDIGNDVEVVRLLDTIRGTISDIETARGFVVIDLGTDNNIRPGDELLVHRAGNYVARVRVSRAEETESVAQVLPSATELTVRRGDEVRITKARYN